ncbi:MAG: ParB/RepB/Spo0J family partition protein [Ottowia sp.]|nr:ParB/RepB/Spo0J family partition protein [Ottowia sp.]
MAARKKLRGLGRGLDALLSPTLGQDDDAAAIPLRVPLDELAPGPWQPRMHMDEGALYELAESIKTQGIMQPILVRLAGDAAAEARYEIIAGERRCRAARLAGLDEVPVLLRDVPDKTAAAMALIENIQRENLNPLEEARGIQRLVDEFELTHDAAAQAVGRSRSAATNLLRLLQLTDPVQTMLMAGDIDMGHARALLALAGGAQINAANQVASRRLSVRQTETLVRKLLAPPRDDAGTKPQKSGDVLRVEDELSDHFSAEVELRIKPVGRGRKRREAGELAIHFASLDELNGLIDRLRKA